MSAAFSLPPGTPPPRQDCVFTTVLLAHGRAVHWDRHRDRLQRSCAELYGERLPDTLDAQVLQQAASAAAPQRLSVRAGATPEGGLVVHLQVATAELGQRPPVHLATVSGRTGDWDHKWCDRAQLDAAQRAVGPSRVPLFVDHDGVVRETSRANVLVVAGSTLLVPAPSRRALPGVTLAVLLERAARAGTAVVEQPVTLDDLDRGVVVTCSSIAGVVAVASVDGHLLPRDEDLLARLRSLLGTGRA